MVLLVVTAALFGYRMLGYPGIASQLPVLIALITAVRMGHRTVAIAPGVALVIGSVLELTLVGGEPVREFVEDRILLAGWLVAAGMMGEAVRQWEAYVTQVHERATEAETTREETARRRAAEERLRIARDLHDSLTHTISVIKIQAGVAAHLARKRGEPVPGELLAIEEASGEAMRELRETLDVLRRDDEAPGSGLDRLPELVERARSAGLPATVTVTGQRRDLPVDVERAAYRIVQEALTNITRHAGPATASVHVLYGPDALGVRVDDDGLGADGPAAGPGVGLLGMRERISALGGSLRAGSRPEGGFSVRAELPVPD